MLHTALVTAPDRSMAPVAAAVAGIALTGAALAFAAGMLTAPHERPVIVRVQPSAAWSALPPASPAPELPPAEPPPMLVFHTAGASYVSLADLPDDDDHDDAIAMPRHGRSRVSREDGITAAVAAIEAGDVPAAYQDWQGRRVEVDDICAAAVVGFAVVSRRADGRGHGRHSPGALRPGHTVLAARLDRCTGSFARPL